MRNEMKSASGGRKRRGFTLIELLVVIAIIGILAVLIFLALERSREAARDSQRKAFCRDIATAEAIYYDTHKGYTQRLTGDNSLVGDKLLDENKFPKACPDEYFGDDGCTGAHAWKISAGSPGGGKSFEISTQLERSDKMFYCDQNGCAER